MGSRLIVAQLALPPVDTGEINDIARFQRIFYYGVAVRLSAGACCRGLIALICE